GEWIGLLKMTGAGVSQLRELGASVKDPARLSTMRMADVFDLLIANGKAVEVVYIRGHWLDVDDLHDVVAASNFGGGGQYR
ncbi:MAG: phosphoenolpyruvate phosphomutase, partial [Chloroflexota bacterium]|nr:phosphoenolpyruvate phosphomutase [Chloroflexota bacterium]